MNVQTIHLRYHALLREERGIAAEEIATDAVSARELYTQLKARHGFSLSEDILRVAVNDEFCDWDRPLSGGDRVVFIPPVAGG